jgi:alkanesulfonate monooxygenase SsuD/methylene tetrahydromethanopterin reductase-like flavin-dependent oxidoreductase (luciferase family)
MTWELERQQTNPDRERAYKGELSFKEYDDKGFIIAGSPATVRQRMRELATELRVGQIIATPHIGDLSEETARKNTYLFATEVIPHLRDIWAEWPDHWTPKVSQERVAQAAGAVAVSSD